MAQLRAKQIKLANAGDLLVGGIGGNGSVLPKGADNQVLKIVAGGLAYADNAAADIAFAPVEGKVAATTVQAAIIEVLDAVTGGSNAKFQALQDELDATQLAAGLSVEGVYEASTTANYITGANNLFAADVALDAALKAVDTAYKAADVALDGRLVTAEADIDALEGRATAIEDAATALAGRVTTAEGAIDALEAEAADIRVDFAAADAALQTQIDNLTGLKALHFKGTVAGDAVEAPAGALQGDVFRVTSDGETNFAGLELKVGDFVAHAGFNNTGTEEEPVLVAVWVKFDNTDPTFESGNAALTVGGSAHAGYTLTVNNDELSFAALKDVDTADVGFLKWDGSKVAFVTPGINDIDGLEARLAGIEADVAALENALAPVAHVATVAATTAEAVTLAHTPVANTLVVSVNGLVLAPAAYTLTGDSLALVEASVGYVVDGTDTVVVSYTYMA